MSDTKAIPTGKLGMKKLMVRLGASPFVPATYYRADGDADAPAGTITVFLERPDQRTVIFATMTNRKLGYLEFSEKKDRTSPFWWSPGWKKIRAFATAEPLLDPRSVKDTDLKDIPIAIEQSGDCDIPAPPAPPIEWRTIELDVLPFLGAGVVGSVDPKFSQKVLGGVPAERLQKIQADLADLLKDLALRAVATSSMDGKMDGVAVEKRLFALPLAGAYANVSTSTPASRIFENGFYRARMSQQARAGGAAGETGTVGVSMDLYRLTPKVTPLPLDGLSPAAAASYSDALRAALREQCAAPKAGPDAIALEKVESQWFKGTKDKVEHALASRIAPAAAKTIIDRCIYFGIGASVDEAVAYALNAASSRFKVSITEAQNDAIGKGVAVDEHVAVGIFQFATGHTDLDFYMRPLKDRVPAWTRTLPAEVRKTPSAFTYRVDGYASALGDRKINTRLAADRKARVWAALQAALELDAKTTVGGDAHPNALEDPPDPTLLTAVESGQDDGLDRRGDAEEKNPAKHRVAIVQVLRRIAPASKDDDVQVVEYRQDAKTAIPVYRFDLVAYERTQVGGEPVTMVMIFFYPGEKIGG